MLVIFTYNDRRYVIFTTKIHLRALLILDDGVSNPLSHHTLVVRVGLCHSISNDISLGANHLAGADKLNKPLSQETPTHDVSHYFAHIPTYKGSCT